MEDWKESDINVDSLWIIPERAKGGKRTNAYHGNFVPQIPYQLISRYTAPRETVLELFTGSGTTLFECESLGRNYIGFDINEEMLQKIREKMVDTHNISYILNNCDVTDASSFSSAIESSLRELGVSMADLILAHPPYMDIVRFTDHPCDLSHIGLVEPFLKRLSISFTTAFRYLKKGGYMGVVMGDVYKESQVVPLSFYVMEMIRRTCKVKLKGIVIKNIEGNRGKLGQQNIWRYRALKSDYYLFKHEYIFVFKKL